MHIYPFLVAVALAAPQFEVQTLEGDAASGTLAAFDGERLQLQTPTGTQDFPTKNLLLVTAQEPAQTAARTPVLVVLTDGSQLPAAAFRKKGSTATVEISANLSLELPVKALRSVRFVDPAATTEKVDTAWNEIASTENVGDLLAVRKQGQLEPIEGVVGDVTAEIVGFSLDGDPIDVKRPRIEGIVFAQTATANLPVAKCLLTTSNGAKLAGSELKLDAETLQVTTPAGAKLAVPLAEAMQFDFSAGKVLYLSDLTPESFNYEPFFALAQPLPSLNDFYRLERDRALTATPLTLDGRKYRKGLALHSKSTVVYRLPDKFRTFRAVVGIDDSAKAAGGNVELEISGDGKSLWKGTVRGDEPARTVEFDVSGVRRLQIVAAFGQGQDVADHLDLCDAKVTK